MKRFTPFLAAILFVCLAPFVSAQQFGVYTNADGTLKSPTTFFTANAAAIASAGGGGGGSGTVTSVQATVPSFLNISGGPITGAGTLAFTYSGTALPVANGGTGGTSAAAARTALGVAATSHTHALSDLTQSGATTNQVPRWNGTAWVPATVSGGGGGDAFLAGPQTFTGINTFPTPAVDTNTTQVATTEFVIAQAASATPIINGSAAVGTSTRYARADHVHPVDTSRAASTHTHAESDVTGLVADLAAKMPKAQVGKIATFGFDGQGSVVPSGTSTMSTTIPAAATITGYAIESDQTASGVVDILMATGTGSFSSITASAKPTLSSQVWVDSSVLTSWTTSIAAKARLKATITGTASGTKFNVVVYGTLN